MKPSWFTKRAIFALALLVVAGCTALRPARNDELFASIHRGMPMAEVREHLGAPDETMAFTRTRSTAWSWFYYDTWGFYTEFSATFDDRGRVTDTFAKRVGYGGGGRD